MYPSNRHHSNDFTGRSYADVPAGEGELPVRERGDGDMVQLVTVLGNGHRLLGRGGGDDLEVT